jgi:hypothetical protein
MIENRMSINHSNESHLSFCIRSDLPFLSSSRHVGIGFRRIYDMGGHRGQRKKWIHYFDHVDLIVFVASLNEFDQVLQEDQETNRMTDSLMLFERKSIKDHHWFSVYIE